VEILEAVFLEMRSTEICSMSFSGFRNIIKHKFCTYDCWTTTSVGKNLKLLKPKTKNILRWETQEFSVTEQLKWISSINSELSACTTTIKSHYQWSTDFMSHHGNSARQKKVCIFLTSRTVLAWKKIVAGVNA